MIPLRDTVRSRRFPLITIGLLLVNVFVFVQQVLAGRRAERLLLAYGLIPERFVHFADFGLPPLSPVRFLPLLTSMFFHGGLFHLLGNMLFLWIFADNIEDKLGRGRFTLFYVLCGVCAAFAQIAQDPESTIPMIGASGAIAGVLGAYLITFPRAKVLTLVPLFFIPWLVEVPAVVFLLLWFATQVLSAWMGFGHEVTGGVAVWAHIGGFLSGIAWMKLLEPRGRR